MRDIKTLYQILLDNFDSIMEDYKQYAIPTPGICYVIGSIIEKGKITIQEHEALSKDFLNRYPKMFSKFWWNWNFYKSNSVYWWTRDEAGNKQRKLFIQDIISKL